MLKKDYRIRKKRDFLYIYKHGKSFSNNNAVLYILKSKSFKAGFSVSKKIGNSVTRSKIKRRLSEIIRLNTENIKPFRLILIARKPIAELSFDEIRKSTIELLHKADLFIEK